MEKKNKEYKEGIEEEEVKEGVMVEAAIEAKVKEDKEGKEEIEVVIEEEREKKGGMERKEGREGKRNMSRRKQVKNMRTKRIMIK